MILFFEPFSQVCSSVDGPRCFADEDLSVIPQSVVQHAVRPPDEKAEIESNLVLGGGHGSKTDVIDPDSVPEKYAGPALAQLEMTQLDRVADLVGAQHLPGGLDYDSFRKGLVSMDGRQVNLQK